VVRFGGIYGGAHGRLQAKIKRGDIAPATPVRYTNRIHRDDCAGFLVHLLAMAAQGKEIAAIYNGVDHHPAPAHEVEQWIADALGCATRKDTGTVSEQPLSHKRCSNRLLRETGYTLHYPDYRAGYREMCGHAK
jgi:nucleoside-diphosphate-sugar epimerase